MQSLPFSLMSYQLSRVDSTGLWFNSCFSKGGSQIAFDYFTLNDNSSYLTVSRRIPGLLHEKLLVFASLISPSNSRTIVLSQYLVTTTTLAKNAPICIVFCSSLNV